MDEEECESCKKTITDGIRVVWKNTSGEVLGQDYYCYHCYFQQW